MLALTCHGNKIKPALVMIHGFLGSGADWASVLPELSKHFYCICIDLPGHGDSPALTLDTPGLYRVATQVHQSISALDINRYHLLGYSLGGRISLHIARQYSEQILSLHLESAHPGLTCSRDRQARLSNDEMWNARLACQNMHKFLNAWYQQGVFSELSESKRQALVETRSKNCAQGLQSIYLATSLAVQEDLSQLPNQIPTPCHYYVGKNDSKFLALALDWQHKSQLTVHQFEQAGHNVHLAATDKFCQQLILQLTETPQ
ncbi:2-succinyl-6-hydroxy-2,4-cyclohexadiene-1-carboxylate synthase [Shewanella violacea]|uniref:Putative 2-succinyl-6-hydroxy-2,4-cyclohexadiene-1-carboxylate synthase n=1 Tax=Shewanella violacea (strain JCM 10179 / CIP 106290 / LMG 19151 / DSS12) TaxID=637905 RepID=D4ZEG0_SHEVD|nr:2-succinyl-6-hydroxy-2,4-cyclohexadiene-1-carboxylate synthase [Shewanella violacea]BAJ00190.1 hydrolase, alpha/beta fold family [Shewanella violacea DSS12]